jgi:hypothetical protein
MKEACTTRGKTCAFEPPAIKNSAVEFVLYAQFDFGVDNGIRDFIRVEEWFWGGTINVLSSV